MRGMSIRIKKAKDGSYIVEHSYRKRVIYKGEKIPTTKYYDDDYTAKNEKELIKLVKKLVTTLASEPEFEETFKEIAAE